MRKVLISAILALSLNGCVWTHNMDFSVPAPELRTTANWGQSIGVSVSVSDYRVDRTVLGTTFIPENGRQYQIRPNSGMEAPVRDGIIAELNARGIRIAAGPAFLLVDILKAEGNSTLRGMSTMVQVTTELRVRVVGADGREHFQRVYQRADAGRADFWTWNYLEQGGLRLQTVMGGLLREVFDDAQLTQALVNAGRGA